MKSAFSLGLILALFFVFNYSNAQELHTHSNAASIANETNSTDGWTGSATRTADTSNPHHGSYAMKLVSTSVVNTGRRANYSFVAIVGETYDISIWAKAGSQTLDPAFASWTGVTGFSNPTIISTNGTWAEYTFTVTATSTSPLIRIYTGSSSGSVGDELYIDQVSITLQNQSDTQAPSTPTNLSSSGNTDTTANLSWDAATDNTGVTNYKVFKDGTLEASLGNMTTYQVTGLTASTSYNFTVSALDAANNESAPSTAVSVTTDAASGGGGSGSSVWSETGSTASYTGDVAIGTSSVPSGYRLVVDGHIRTREIRVDQDTWPDYVFKEGYDLPSLEEIQKHIKEKGHLPNIPSAKEVEANGIELGEMNKLLLEKIEELTLYIIKQENSHKNELETLEKRISHIEKNYKKHSE